MAIALRTHESPRSLVLPCCACDSRAEDTRLPRTAALNVMPGVMVTSDEAADCRGAVAEILMCTGFFLFPSIEEDDSPMTRGRTRSDCTKGRGLKPQVPESGFPR